MLQCPCPSPNGTAFVQMIDIFRQQFNAQHSRKFIEWIHLNVLSKIILHLFYILSLTHLSWSSHGYNVHLLDYYWFQRILCAYSFLFIKLANSRLCNVKPLSTFRQSFLVPSLILNAQKKLRNCDSPDIWDLAPGHMSSVWPK